MNTPEGTSTNDSTAEPTLSPLDDLGPEIRASPFRLAPERQTDLQALVTKHNIHGILDLDDPSLLAGTFVILGQVYLGLKSLERLWGLCYVSVVIWNQWQSQGFKGKLDLGAINGKTALDVFDWGLPTNNYEDWAPHFPKPANNSDPDVNLANELFLGCCGFATLHEIGHIALQHSAPPGTLRDVLFQQEFEADRWAYQWILQSFQSSESNAQIYTKRRWIIGALLALGAIIELDGLDGSERQQHPNPVERVQNFVNEYVVAGPVAVASNVGGFISGIFDFYLSQRCSGYNEAQSHVNVNDYLNKLKPLFE